MFVSSLLRVSFVFAAIIATGAAAPAQPTPSPSAPNSQQIQLSIHQHDGAAAVDVSGMTLPNSFVFLTETAKLSVDLPIVTLNHFIVRSDAGGAFKTTLPIAPVSTPTTQIIVEAQSTGIAPNTVAFVVGQPTSGPIVPLMDNQDFP